MTGPDLSRRGFLGKGALAVGAGGLAGCSRLMPQKSAAKPMNVKYGLNLLLYTPTFSKDRVDLVKKVAEMGFEGVEVPFNDLSVLDAKATRHALESCKMGMTACCVMMPGTSLCSTKAEERNAGVERIKKMVDITAEMGGDTVAGPIYTPVGQLTGKARTADEWKWCRDGFRAASEHAEKAKIDLAIEPLNRFETYVLNTVGDATKLCQEVNHPRLKVQADTFHGNIEEKDTAAAIRACGPFLGHFHASESDRGVPGTGQVRWGEVFAALHDIGYDRWVTIESFATGIVDLCAAACIWRPIYDDPDKLATDGLAFLKACARRA
ncbi:MAG: sugar phosphate isomerase/epimerase [Candidatus Brocadiae bacterium]|nr:sugar phosphate isomerase/epimerase [Candidatus Brocadiia bacterium]